MSIREGYKQTEFGVIPEEWKVVKLKDILTVKYGKSQKEVEDPNGQYPILGTGGIMGYAREFLWDKPSVLIGRKGTIDKPQYMETPFWTVDTLFYTDIKLDKALPKYIFYKFQTIQWRTFNEASGVPSLSAPNIHNIRMALPPLPEQQKIAAILTCVDNKIEVIDEQIAKAETLKKGLMQKLLSEGIGHTEFKESEIGRIPKEWEVVRLGDCIVGKGRYGINAPAVDQDESLPIYLRITDIDENGRFISSNKKCVSHKDSSDYKLSEGDIVFARTGNTTGKTYLYNPDDGELVYAGFLIKFTPNKSKLDSYYLKLITGTARYWNWVKVMSTRTGQPGINSEEYAKFLLPLPPLPEQKQIAKILSTADDKLETLREKRERYEQLKKGLMQKLLTGEVRVEI